MTLKVYHEQDVLVWESIDGEPEIARLREATREAQEEATRDERVQLGELANVVKQQRQRDSAGDPRATLSA